MITSNDFNLLNENQSKSSGSPIYGITYNNQGIVLQPPRYRSIYGQHELLIKTVEDQPDFLLAEFFNLSDYFGGTNLATSGYQGFKFLELNLNIGPLVPNTDVEYSSAPGVSGTMTQVGFRIILGLPYVDTVSSNPNDYTLESSILNFPTAETYPLTDFGNLNIGTSIYKIDNTSRLAFDLSSAALGTIKVVGAIKSLRGNSTENTTILKGTYLLT